jgi:hypothetical protein
MHVGEFLRNSQSHYRVEHRHTGRVPDWFKPPVLKDLTEILAASAIRHGLSINRGSIPRRRDYRESRKTLRKLPKRALTVVITTGRSAPTLRNA